MLRMYLGITLKRYTNLAYIRTGITIFCGLNKCFIKVSHAFMLT